MVQSTRVLTNKAAKICKQLAHNVIDIPTPSQVTIYKSVFKEAVKLKGEMIETLQVEQWSLRFDGKHIGQNEYHVTILKSCTEKTEVKLHALCLKDGKAETAAAGVAKVLD